MLLGQHRCPPCAQAAGYPRARRYKTVIKPLTRDFAGAERWLEAFQRCFCKGSFTAPHSPNPKGDFSSASPTALIMSEHPLPGTNHLRSLKTSIPWGKLCWEGTASPTWRDQNRQGKRQLVGKRRKNNWRKGQFPGTGHPALCHPGCPSLSTL